jgi:hypothetical protein
MQILRNWKEYSTYLLIPPHFTVEKTDQERLSHVQGCKILSQDQDIGFLTPFSKCQPLNQEILLKSILLHHLGQAGQCYTHTKKRLREKGQTYLKGFSPVWVRMWLLRVVAPAKARPQ